MLSPLVGVCEKGARRSKRFENPKTRPTILPLPKGEGRGEGKGTTHNTSKQTNTAASLNYPDSPRPWGEGTVIEDFFDFRSLLEPAKFFLQFAEAHFD
jgi:hypothetical protein